MPAFAERLLLPLTVAAAVACGLFLAGLHVDSMALRLAGKPWIHLALLAWILARDDGARGNGAYARRVAAAIAVCMAADFILELRGAMFLVGTVVFLVAQLALASAFVLRTRTLQPLAALPVAAALGVAFAVISPGLGAMRIPVTAYMVAIGTMMWRAVACVTADVARAGATERLAMVGALVFGLSDTLIAIDRFHAPFAGARWAIILTYWAALVLLAASAVRSQGAPSRSLPRRSRRSAFSAPPALPRSLRAGSGAAARDRRSRLDRR